MIKKIDYNSETRDALKRGVDILANAVKITLGPKGRNVIIERDGRSPYITKDGVTVANEIEIEDSIENMGAQMVKEVASKTADMAGDGTTTATILAQTIVTAGIKNVASGANPLSLKKGMDLAVACVINHLKSQSILISHDDERVKQIATISANNDYEIGELVAKAMKAVGENGVITIDDSKGVETEINVVQGMQFNNGYLSPYFINNQSNNSVEFENVDLFLTNQKLSSLKDLYDLFGKQIQTGKPLLIIADDVNGEALATLVVNVVKRSLKYVAVKSPGFGHFRKEIMEDIAVLTGAAFISDEKGEDIKNISLESFGHAEKVIITETTTTIIKGGGDQKSIQNRKNDLKNQINSTTVAGNKKSLQERLAKLSGGVAVLYVGATTEVEMKEKKDRVDDALHATRAAVEEGIVAGGGVAFIRAIEALANLKGINEDENTGIQIIRRAIEEPLRQICENAGIEGSIVVQKVKEGKVDFGYNALTGRYEKLIKAGIIDPTKVARVALENATSIASMILTTMCTITNKR